MVQLSNRIESGCKLVLLFGFRGRSESKHWTFSQQNSVWVKKIHKEQVSVCGPPLSKPHISSSQMTECFSFLTFNKTIESRYLVSPIKKWLCQTA